MLLRGLTRGLSRGLNGGLVPSIGDGQALTFSNLFSGTTAFTSTTDATSFLVTSIAPAANAAVYLGVISQQAVAAVQPTVIGNGLTYVAEKSVAFGTRRVTVFRAMGPAPTAGQPTVDFGAGNTQTSIIVSAVQVANADRSGANAAGATRQSTPNSDTAKTTIVGTLAAMLSSKSAHLYFCGLNLNSAITVGTGFTEIAQGGVGTNANRLQVAYKLFDTTADPTFASADCAIISLEVR